MKRHDLKIWPEQFEAMALGLKTCEVRLNDRNFTAGDILDLREFDPDEVVHTGRYIVAFVRHLQPLSAFGCPSYVAMSVETMEVSQ